MTPGIEITWLPSVVPTGHGKNELQSRRGQASVARRFQSLATQAWLSLLLRHPLRLARHAPAGGGSSGSSGGGMGGGEKGIFGFLASTTGSGSSCGGIGGGAKVVFVLSSSTSRIWATTSWPLVNSAESSPWRSPRA